MKVEYEFPALVRVIRSGSDIEKHALCRVRDIAELRHVYEGDAPIAAVVEKKDGRSVYRYHEGKIHALVGRFSDLKNNDTRRRMLRRTGVEQSLMRRVVRELREIGRSRFTPDNALALVGGMVDTPLSHIAADALFRAYPVPDNWTRIQSFDDRIRNIPHRDEDVEMWRHYGREALESVFVCDDRVWTNVPDPCIVARLRKSSTYIGFGDAAFYGAADHFPKLHDRNIKAPAYWEDLDSTCFPLIEWQDALEFTADHARRQAYGITQTREVTDVKVLRPDAFTFDFRKAEFRRLADSVFFLGTEATRQPSNPSVMRKNVPEEFIEALLEFEAARDIEGDNSEELEAALDGIFSVIHGLEQELTKLRVKTDSFKMAIEIGLDRWDNRPIETAFDRAFASCGA